MDETARAALLQAIDNFRPERSLETKEDFDRFYVPRPLVTLAELAEQVRVAAPEAKFLVYGHRGCGKTSELNKLARELADSHFAVVLSLEAENDLSDLHYTELLTALCRRLVYEAGQRGLEISRGLLDDVLNWFAEVDDLTERKLSVEGGATQKVGLYFLEQFSQQKAEFSKRQERRLKRQQHEGELLSLINRLIDEVQHAAAQAGAGQTLLAIIDSLDRCKLETVKEVFKYTEALRAPAMKTIYTVPLAFSRDPQFTDVTRDFGDYRCTIPVITLFTRDGQRDEGAWGLAQAILTLRFLGLTVPEPVKDLLIAHSGGVLSILFTLCYNACVLALARNTPTLDPASAKQVCIEYQDRFYQRLREEDYVVLSQTFPSRHPRVDERFLSLLYTSCILQHSTNGISWYDLHPLVRELVDEWRTARQDAPSATERA